MSVFVYAEHIDGVYKKSTLEAVSYAKILADRISDNVVAISVNAENIEKELYQYGVNKVINLKNEELKNFDSSSYAKALADVFDGEIFVFPHSEDSVSVAPILSVIKGISLATNVLDVPESFEPILVKKKVFSGKGIVVEKLLSSKAILTLAQNSFSVKENLVEGEYQEIEVNYQSKIKVEKTEKSEETINLTDADIVVSGGRGLKTPENWYLIEDLASALGAAKGCSKPVSDMGWRSHSEHVGQTGKNISPNLYVAVGISGAIQHLAGVNSSKTILVINNDPQAPFFKSADYGILGDAMSVLPKLTEKIKQLK